MTFDIGDDFFRDPQGRLNGNAMVTVNAGETVGWRHIGANDHTVTSVSGPEAFNSPTLRNGNTFTFTPTMAGTYTFRCDFHPAIMLGSTIQVN